MKKLISASRTCLINALVTVLATNVFTSTTVFAHEKSFPTKQLSALTPEGQEVTFKETPLRPSMSKISDFEKKYSVKFSKGELAGSLFVGDNSDKKSRLVVVFLDGKSDSGDTEFGAAINTQGRVAKVQIFSSSEPGAKKEFVASLTGKSAEELSAMVTALDKSPSEKFLTTLALKAVGRVSASFK